MPRVMIVDDDEFLHKVMSRILALGGYEVVAHAYNGLEAYKMYSELEPPPDVVLMDHRMPIMNGTQATREIRRIDPSAKVLFVSADESAESEAYQAGAVGFLVKPLRSTELFNALKRVLDEQPT
ncbi:MAG: response regulator [Candidatus Thorarchaeota archaeon]